jgi:hypothetical protein
MFQSMDHGAIALDMKSLETEILKNVPFVLLQSNQILMYWKREYPLFDPRLFHIPHFTVQTFHTIIVFTPVSNFFTKRDSIFFEFSEVRKTYMEMAISEDMEEAVTAEHLNEKERGKKETLHAACLFLVPILSILPFYYYNLLEERVANYIIYTIYFFVIRKFHFSFFTPSSIAITLFSVFQVPQINDQDFFSYPLSVEDLQRIPTSPSLLPYSVSSILLGIDL